MTKTTSQPAAPAIVLFGLDGQGRPLAASFAADQTALALKAAISLNLQTLKVETADQVDLAKQLPVGAIPAAGRATVPLVSKVLFDKLLALRPRRASRQAATCQPPLRPNHLPAPATSHSQSGHRPVGPKLRSATWCSSKTGTRNPAGSRPWSSNSLATTSSNSGSGIIPKKEPWCAAAISWRSCHPPKRQCLSAHEPS